MLWIITRYAVNFTCSTVCIWMRIVNTSYRTVCEHVSNTIASCAQSVHALRILRSHGLLDDSICVIYRAVVIVYASSAWWGFTTADDRQRLEAVIRRGIWSRLCNPDQTTLAEMIEQADNVLFSQALNNNHMYCTHFYLINSKQHINSDIGVII